MPPHGEPDPRDSAALDWARQQLHDLGLDGGADAQLMHDRPWSRLYRLGTPEAPHWLKVPGPRLRHEGLLVRTIARYEPDLVLAPEVVDTEHGWLVMPDGGTLLRAFAPGAATLPHWERLLPQYAALQRTLVPHMSGLLAGGAPDRRPQRTVALADELAALFTGDEAGLPEDFHVRFDGVRPALAQAANELAESTVGSTVNHDDLHSSNIFVALDADQQVVGYRISDWGDAAVAHPFTTLNATLRSAAAHAELEVNDPQVIRLRDVYLDAWSDLADRTDLLRWCELARWTGCVSRAAAWEWALTAALNSDDAVVTASARQDRAEYVAGWLDELTDIGIPAGVS